jgi:uncharacterized protein
MRIFLDANILFSAAQLGSPMRQMVERMSQSETLATSDYAWTEAERNVAAKRREWAAGLRQLYSGLAVVSALADCGVVTLDVADRPILGAAIAARCARLLTGDQRHFGPLMGKSVQGVTIVSARALATELGYGR